MFITQKKLRRLLEEAEYDQGRFVYTDPLTGESIDVVKGELFVIGYLPSGLMARDKSIAIAVCSVIAHAESNGKIIQTLPYTKTVVSMRYLCDVDDLKKVGIVYPSHKPEGCRTIDGPSNFTAFAAAKPGDSFFFPSSAMWKYSSREFVPRLITAARHHQCMVSVKCRVDGVIAMVHARTDTTEKQAPAMFKFTDGTVITFPLAGAMARKGALRKIVYDQHHNVIKETKAK